MARIQSNISDKYYFIVFSDDWGEHPSSCQHLFKIIGKYYQVLWVNTIGMRNMRFTQADFRKAFLKVGKMIEGKGTGKKVYNQDNLKVDVIQPFMLPFVQSKLIRKANAQSVILSILRKSKDYAGLVPIIVTTVPNSCDYVDKLRAERIVYYCVDDFSEWPGLKQDLVREMENELIGKADIFTATSSKIYNKLVKTGKHTQLLTHGVDVEHFANLPKEEHPLLKDIPKPRIGYYGLFDERSDQELILQLSKKFQQFSFVITGDVVVNVTALESQRNVYFTGAVPYKELPGIIAGWDICMLPYLLNELSESISPLKYKEYLATGKIVLSTPLPEVVNIGFNSYISGDIQGWSEFIQEILIDLKPRKKSIIQEHLANESWEKKAEKFLNFQNMMSFEKNSSGCIQA